jgi:hypothetical protein
MKEIGWWGLFLKTGNPDIYMLYKGTQKEEPDETLKVQGHCDTVCGCGRLQ